MGDQKTQEGHGASRDLAHAGSVKLELEGLPRKALSIRQPWAWLIVNGYKDIENRSWPTNYRGPVLIHAGKAWGPDERDTMEDLRAGMNPADYRDLSPPVEGLPDTPDLGGIVGVAEIVGCVAASDSRWFVGDYGFMIRNARPLPFMPCKGALGFFVPDFAEQPTKPAPPPAVSRTSLQPPAPDLFAEASPTGQSAERQPSPRDADPLPQSKATKP